MKRYLLLVLIGILFGCSNNNKKADAYGNFEATEIVVSSELNGKIVKLIPDEGDLLKKGDFMCQTDSTELHFSKDKLVAKINAVEEAIKIINSQSKQAEIEKKNLEKEINRFQNLVSANAATDKQLDDLNFKRKLNLEKIKQMNLRKKQSEFEKKSMQNELDILKDKIKKSTILSPINGVILKKFVEENELANYGKPLFSIANLEELNLMAYTSGEQLSQMKIGQEVTVKIDKPNDKMKSYKGIITNVSNKSEFTPKIIQTKDERVSQVYAIKIKVKNDGFLKIGMPAEVEFK